MRIFILTRGYPADDRLYNHSFVHRRVLEYRALGHDVHIFWIRPRGDIATYIFQDIPVSYGGAMACLDAISAFQPDAIAAHAMADDFWPVLSQVSPDIPVNAWIYGSEILPFHKVTEKADHDAARADKARLVFERRIAFWRQLIDHWPANLRLVFVSHYAAQSAELAVGRAIPRWIVQPTGVDRSLFRGREKHAALRFNILSIRPFSDWRYANDLSVAAIVLLQGHKDFSKFQFHFVGDGHLFDEILAPIRAFPNVHCEKRFLHQAEIADLHAINGVFLCPSRDDAQGVSRDEAMSSALVPIVTDAGAVPEFVNRDCGILVQPESPSEIADALAMLADQPALFQRLSRGASERIAHHIAMPQVITRELEILKS